MKNKIILIIILVLAFVLRAKGYDRFPVAGSSFDEYANTFVGMSILKLGYPIGFTIIDGYQNKEFVNFVFKDIPDRVLTYKIVYPWFDHPPLLCLVTGGWAIINGVSRFNDVTIHLVRQPMIILGLLTVFFIYLLAKEWFNEKIGLLSAFLAAIYPTMVIGCRTVQAENLLIPLSLGSLYFFKKYLDLRKTSYLILTGLFLILAMLTKFSGVFLFISLFFILIKYSKSKKEIWSDIMAIFSFFIFGVLIFVVWGWGFDIKTFLKIFFSNSDRVYAVGFDYFFILLRSEAITLAVSLWTGLGLMFSFCLIILSLLSKIKHKYFVLIPLIVYFSILVLFGSKRFGWYAFPLYPFLAIVGALVFDYLYKKAKNFILMIALIFLPFSSIMSQIVSSEQVAIYKNYWRFPIFLIIMFLIFLYCSGVVKEKFNRKIEKSIFWIIAIMTIGLSIFYSLYKSV